MFVKSEAQCEGLLGPYSTAIVVNRNLTTSPLLGRTHAYATIN